MPLVKPVRGACVVLLLFLLPGCGGAPTGPPAGTSVGTGTPTAGTGAGWVRLAGTDLSVSVPPTFERITDAALGPRDVAARSPQVADQPRVLVQVGHISAAGQDPDRLAGATRGYDRAAARLAGATVEVRRTVLLGEPVDVQVWSGPAPAAGGRRLVHVQAVLVRGPDLLLVTGQGPEGDDVRRQLLAIVATVRAR